MIRMTRNPPFPSAPSPLGMILPSWDKPLATTTKTPLVPTATGSPKPAIHPLFRRLALLEFPMIMNAGCLPHEMSSEDILLMVGLIMIIPALDVIHSILNYRSLIHQLRVETDKLEGLVLSGIRTDSRASRLYQSGEFWQEQLTTSDLKLEYLSTSRHKWQEELDCQARIIVDLRILLRSNFVHWFRWKVMSRLTDEFESSSPTEQIWSKAFSAMRGVSYILYFH